MKFKDTNNQVHEIEEGFEHLLPAGCVEITQAEADELLAPPPPTLNEVYTAKLKESNDKCDEALKAITDLYSASERETWVIQELEASNFQHDVDNLVEPKRATPNLDWIIVEKDGLPVDDVKRQALTTRILTKAIAFHQFSSLTVGKRHKMTGAVELAFADAEAAIAAAVTPEEAEAAELAGIAALEAIVFQ